MYQTCPYLKQIVTGTSLDTIQHNIDRFTENKIY